MARVNYRVVTLCSALGAALLMCFALGCLVTSLVNFRAEDFLTASKTEDMTTLGVGGTCVETLTDAQLLELEYTKTDLKCGDNREQGNRVAVRNSLSASVHAVMYAYYYHATFPGTLSGADFGEYKFYQVVGAMLTHIMGGTTTDGAGVVTQNVPVGINYTTADYVLRAVSQLEIPVSCDDIYGLTFATDIDNNDRFTDSPMELYIKDIREGRFNSDEEIKETWPLTDLIVDCDDELLTMGDGTLQNPGAPASAIPTATKAMLHAHCHAQFLFASRRHAGVGRARHGIPLPGIEPGPAFTALPAGGGLQQHVARTPCSARMYLGQRFGFSVWAYVPMFLADVLPARRRGGLLPRRGASCRSRSPTRKQVLDRPRSTRRATAS